MNNKRATSINVRPKSFFKYFLEFTEPFHKLTGQQQTVVALLLFYRYELSKVITNDKILWSQTFDYDQRMRICEEMKIKPVSLENLLSQIRKKGIIVDNQIIARFVPEIDESTKQFQLIYNFNIINERPSK